MFALSFRLNDIHLVYKAANLIKKTFNINKGVEIHIKKNIPVAAGMAGGSSNAAAVLVGLNKLWNLNLSNQQLEKIGLKLGSYVPFCINGGAVLASGIGEELTPIKGLTKDVCLLNLYIHKLLLLIQINLVYRLKYRHLSLTL